MSKTIKIEVMDPVTPDLVHRFRNFGEAIYMALRETCAGSIEEIDRSTNSFTLRKVRPRDIPLVIGALQKELRRHHFDQTAVVTRE